MPNFENFWPKIGKIKGFCLFFEFELSIFLRINLWYKLWYIQVGNNGLWTFKVKKVPTKMFNLFQIMEHATISVSTWPVSKSGGFTASASSVLLGVNKLVSGGWKHSSCVEMFCETDFSHRGVNWVGNQGVPIGEGLRARLIFSPSIPFRFWSRIVKNVSTDCNW